jgi:hypothetical protein
MLAVTVTLDFACCRCEESVHVTVRCEGKGLAAGQRTVAAVKVPCPECGAINQVLFEPGGQVRDVVPCDGPRQVPEPSLN